MSNDNQRSIVQMTIFGEDGDNNSFVVTDERTQMIWDEAYGAAETFVSTIEKKLEEDGFATPIFGSALSDVLNNLSDMTAKAIRSEMNDDAHAKDYAENDARKNVKITARHITLSQQTGDVLVCNAEVAGSEWVTLVKPDSFSLPTQL
ncbi:hypothetical protein B9479_003731 [Cryptococcus floricola]|uniref:Uncharacterized protein n=1 Tax=Cryptococcus floricola TaxID=2591691 RepID=A0A5D3AZ81_9TREE|nr:hypothetical protein B9479_003731 [Cryptococcus floricola]